MENVYIIANVKEINNDNKKNNNISKNIKLLVFR